MWSSHGNWRCSGEGWGGQSNYIILDDQAKNLEYLLTFSFLSHLTFNLLNSTFSKFQSISRMLPFLTIPSADIITCLYYYSRLQSDHISSLAPFRSLLKTAVTPQSGTSTKIMRIRTICLPLVCPNIFPFPKLGHCILQLPPPSSHPQLMLLAPCPILLGTISGYSGPAFNDQHPHLFA